MHIYETHKMQDPRLPFIFDRDRIAENRPATVYNWHANIEIISVTEGGGYITVGDDRIYAREGEIVVINQNNLHGFATAELPLAYDYLILDNSFLAENHFDMERLFFKGAIADAEISSMISRFAFYWFSEESTPLRVQHLRALAMGIALLLGERYAVDNREMRGETHLLSCIKQAIGFVRAEGHRDISLDEVSSFVGLSKYYFAREFRRITGYSFVAYLNIVRCEKAKELLIRGGLSVGEICRACGFSSPSYFSQTFRTYTGITPNRYRREHHTS